MHKMEEVKPELFRIYSELGGDPNRIKAIRIIDFTYQIIRDDGAYTEIPRIVIDDYYGREPGKVLAEEAIKEALKNFKL